MTLINKIILKSKYSYYKRRIKRIKKIYICTPAKVASSAFLHSLSDNYNVKHGHSLIDLRKILSEKNNFIISGIRNPVDRNLSYFFQTYSDNKFNDFKIRINNYKGENCFVFNKEELFQYKINEVIKIFKKQESLFTFNDWFDEFFEITKIYSRYSYNKSKGIKLYRLDNNNLLLFYTFENLQSNYNIINYLFNIRELQHTNNPINRRYFEYYKKIKNKISYEKEYINRLLNTRIMKYFYNNTEIDNFINQCRMNNNDIR